MNSKLEESFTKEEVETTLHQMAPLKYLGLDGFGASFYHKHWKIVSPEVCDAVLNILNKEGTISSLISTFIALIPNKVNSNSVTNFWPISLCNVLYMFISKTITNRLKPLMHSLISRNQSVFIPDRLIIDNIMVAHELLHSKEKEKWESIEDGCEVRYVKSL